MKSRVWATEEKMAIVLEGLKGEKAIAEICREHQVSQPQFYKWRDKFLEGGKQALTNRNGQSEDKRYKVENDRLKKIIGEQAIIIDALKKTSV